MNKGLFSLLVIILSLVAISIVRPVGAESDIESQNVDTIHVTDPSQAFDLIHRGEHLEKAQLQVGQASEEDDSLD